MALSDHPEIQDVLRMVARLKIPERLCSSTGERDGQGIGGAWHFACFANRRSSPSTVDHGTDADRKRTLATKRALPLKSKQGLFRLPMAVRFLDEVGELPLELPGQNAGTGKRGRVGRQQPESRSTSV
jgi:hypothetical protein